jgi:hypothetical protein
MQKRANKPLEFKIYEGCIEPLAHGRTKPQNAETSGYIEVIGETASARMYYPYVFEFAIIRVSLNNADDCYSHQDPSKKRKTEITFPQVCSLIDIGVVSMAGRGISIGYMAICVGIRIWR